MRASQRIEHDLTLLKRHHGVVAAVDEEHRSPDSIDMPDGGNGVQGRVAVARNTPEAIPIAGRIPVLDATSVIPPQQPRQVGDSRDRDGTPIYRRLQRYAGERGIAALARPYDAHLRRIYDSLLGQTADAIGQVRLHLAAPLSEASLEQLHRRRQRRRRACRPGCVRTPSATRPAISRRPLYSGAGHRGSAAPPGRWLRRASPSDRGMTPRAGEYPPVAPAARIHRPFA